MLWNTPEMFECQFGVPMSGAVLNTINVRLDAPTIAFMLDHGEAKVLITDREFSQALGPALSMCEARPLVIDVDDPGYTGPGVCLGETDYETFLATGDPAHVGSAPQAQSGSCTERENLAGDAKGKGTSGSIREAESTDALEGGGLFRSSYEAGVMLAERRGQIASHDLPQHVVTPPPRRAARFRNAARMVSTHRRYCAPC